MPMIFNRHVSKRAILLAALAAAFVVVWHERDTIHEIAQQAFETNVLLDAEDANQRCTERSKDVQYPGAPSTGSFKQSVLRLGVREGMSCRGHTSHCQNRNCRYLRD